MRLNLGAGRQQLADFVSVDIEEGDVRHNLAEMPWPFPTASAHEIMASHILEHFDRHTGIAFLRECWRVLRPGGVLRIAVPDFDVFADCMVTHDWQPVQGYRWTDANYFFGGDPEREARPHWRHQYAYTFGLLEHLLRNIGFARVTRRGPCELDNHQYAPISLYVDALR